MPINSLDILVINDDSDEEKYKPNNSLDKKIVDNDVDDEYKKLKIILDIAI